MPLSITPRRLRSLQRPAPPQRAAPPPEEDDDGGKSAALLLPAILLPALLLAFWLSQWLPQSGLQLVKKAATSLEAGQYRRAEEDLRLAVTLIPTTGQVYTQHGVTLIAHDRREEALPCFETASNLAPDDPHPRRLAASAARAIATETLGRSADAQAVLRRALLTAPRDPEAHVSLARALHGAGSKAAALETMKVAVRLAPRSGSMQYNLGAMLLGLGRTDDARDAFEASSALQPEALAPQLQLYTLAPPSPEAALGLQAALARAPPSPPASQASQLAAVATALVHAHDAQAQESTDAVSDAVGSAQSPADWAEQLRSDGFGVMDGVLGPEACAELRRRAAEELGPQLVAGIRRRTSPQDP